MEKIGKALLNYLMRGLLVVVPIGLTIFVVYWAVTTVDSWVNVNAYLGLDPATGESRNIPGLGLLAVLFLIFLAGIVVTNVITEPVYRTLQKILNKMPLFNFIYSSIKDLTEAFVGDEKKFNHPVLVEVEGNLKKIGFLTQEDLSKLELPNEVVVYFPFSYSFAGQLCVVKKEKIKPLNLSASDAMKFVLSGGVSGL